MKDVIRIDEWVAQHTAPATPERGRSVLSPQAIDIIKQYQRLPLDKRINILYAVMCLTR